jgi:hypothetical protein
VKKTTRWCAAALVAVMATSACSGGKKAKSTTTVPPTTTTTIAPVPAILTGLTLDDAGRKSRPALSVKIENAPEARPQAGLDAADVVYEEEVEGGIVRFLAVFQSHDAPAVGPIRSLRPVDPLIVTPLRGLFAYSGGAPQFIPLIKRAPVTLVGFDEYNQAYKRRGDRPAPHNVYSSTPALYRGAKGNEPAPPALFTFLVAGQQFSAAGSAPATHVEGLVGSTRYTWDLDPATRLYRRGTNGTAHVMENGNQLAFANVIVQTVPYRNTGSRDPSGAPVPVADIVGSGEASIVSGGLIVRGRWSKPSTSSVTQYTDASGAPVSLTPGPTWISLARPGLEITAR